MFCLILITPVQDDLCLLKMLATINDPAVDINATDCRGSTAMHYCKSGAAVQILMRHLADPGAVNNAGFTPLQYMERVTRQRKAASYIAVNYGRA